VRPPERRAERHARTGQAAGTTSCLRDIGARGGHIFRERELPATSSSHHILRDLPGRQDGDRWR